VASGAAAARMAALQIVLVPVSVASLTLGHYFAYRHGAEGGRQRFMLWIATPVSLALWMLPWMSR
jgi:hypothetical protein